MRPLKFRAWDKDEKKMYNLDKSLNSSLMQAMYASECVQGKGNIELMQFTGLLDKNGKEIYEGDILKWVDGDGSIGVVYWAEGDCHYETEPLLNGFDSAHCCYYEIIGNIYENMDGEPTFRERFLKLQSENPTMKTTEMAKILECDPQKIYSLKNTMKKENVAGGGEQKKIIKRRTRLEMQVEPPTTETALTLPALIVAIKKVAEMAERVLEAQRKKAEELFL